MKGKTIRDIGIIVLVILSSFVFGIAGMWIIIAVLGVINISWKIISHYINKQTKQKNKTFKKELN